MKTTTATQDEIREQLEADLRAQIEAEALVEMEALRAALADAHAESDRLRSELEAARDLDRCISVREAAGIVGVSHEYIYKHKQKYPFVVQMGPSRVVVSKRKLREFIERGGAANEDRKPEPGMSLGTANARRKSSRRWK